MHPPVDPAPSTPHRRRWFRLSLRGLMILVLILGGVLGWKVNQVRTQRLAVESVRAAGGIVSYDYQFSRDPAVMKVIRRNKEPSAPAWLRR